MCGHQRDSAKLHQWSILQTRLSITKMQLKYLLIHSNNSFKIQAKRVFQKSNNANGLHNSMKLMITSLKRCCEHKRHLQLTKLLSCSFQRIFFPLPMNIKNYRANKTSDWRSIKDCEHKKSITEADFWKIIS